MDEVGIQKMRTTWEHKKINRGMRSVKERWLAGMVSRCQVRIPILLRIRCKLIWGSQNRKLAAVHMIFRSNFLHHEARRPWETRLWQESIPHTNSKFRHAISLQGRMILLVADQLGVFWNSFLYARFTRGKILDKTHLVCLFGLLGILGFLGSGDSTNSRDVK